MTGPLGHRKPANLTAGSGLSSYCGHDRTPSEISQIASTLINALELHPERIVAVGHSMGALVACELGLRHALRGVVLLGPVHPSSNLADIFAARIKAVEKRKQGHPLKHLIRDN